MTAERAKLYIAAWTAALIIGLAIAIRHRKRLHFNREHVWFLLKPWRLITFAIATTFFVAIAPYSGDPTWDRVDGSMMAIFTFITAPWSMGVLYRALRKKMDRVMAYPAACAWLFSASWCYDAYLYWRDGAYPPTWWSNLIASSVLYVAGGLFWSVTYREGRGVVFAFMLDDWPAREPKNERSWKTIALVCVFGALVAAMMAPFAWEAARGIVNR